MSGSPSRRASATASVGERQPAVGVARVVELQRQPGEQPRAQRRVLAAEQAERLLQDPRDVLLDASELRPAAGVAERGAAEQARVAERPRGVGGERERRPVPGHAGALLRRAEREQQLAAQPVVGRARQLAGAERGAVVPGRLLPRQQAVRAPAGGEREVDRALGPVDRSREREVMRELPEVAGRAGRRGRRSAPPRRGRAGARGAARRARRRASRASARGRTSSARRARPPRRGRTPARLRRARRRARRRPAARPARARRSRTRARSPTRWRASRARLRRAARAGAT